MNEDNEEKVTKIYKDTMIGKKEKLLEEHRISYDLSYSNSKTEKKNVIRNNTYEIMYSKANENCKLKF